MDRQNNKPGSNLDLAPSGSANSWILSCLSSPRLFILRQMYRLLYRNPETNICNLSDLQIRSITGWDLYALKRAREQLIRLKEITPYGYHTFKIKPFQLTYRHTDGKAIY